MVEWRRRRWLVLELFVLGNRGFLGVDIYVAHSINDFANPLEWVPLVFSVVATPLLALSTAGGRAPAHRWRRWLGASIGGASIIVGTAGMILHLESQFFELQSIRSLVYTAPFVAPLAYAGLGFLILLNRMLDPADIEWGRWIVVFGLGGFLGNFVLSLCDHAQNGFFIASEWVPVFSSAFAVGFLALAAATRRDRSFLNLCLAVLLAQAIVGAIGFVFHLRGIAGGVAEGVRENILFGPPVFAPLLFINLAILSGLGIIDLKSRLGGAAVALRAG